MLGMAVETFNSGGHNCQVGDSGELVCVRPFPCMPIGFWPLPGFGTDENVRAAAERFRLAYFAEYKDVWCMFPIVRTLSFTDLIWIKIMVTTC
jgi:acetoacetyl-CoA synthetase